MCHGALSGKRREMFDAQRRAHRNAMDNGLKSYQSEENRNARLNTNSLKFSRPWFPSLRRAHSLCFSLSVSFWFVLIESVCLTLTGKGLLTQSSVGAVGWWLQGGEKSWRVSGLERVGGKFLPGCPTVWALKVIRVCPC